MESKKKYIAQNSYFAILETTRVELEKHALYVDDNAEEVSIPDGKQLLEQWVDQLLGKAKKGDKNSLKQLSELLNLMKSKGLDVDFEALRFCTITMAERLKNSRHKGTFKDRAFSTSNRGRPCNSTINPWWPMHEDFILTYRLIVMWHRVGDSFEKAILALRGEGPHKLPLGECVPLSASSIRDARVRTLKNVEKMDFLDKSQQALLQEILRDPKYLISPLKPLDEPVDITEFMTSAYEMIERTRQDHLKAIDQILDVLEK